MKHIPRKFVTVLVSLMVLGGTALATSPAQAEPSTSAASKTLNPPKTDEPEGGSVRPARVHGNW